MAAIRFIPVVLLLSFQAHAMSFVCVPVAGSARGSVDAKITVNTSSIPETITVAIGGKTVFDRLAVVSTSQGGNVSFQTPAFINKNGAPSGLFMQVYTDTNRKLLGELSESSYLPTIPNLSLECESR